MMELFWAFATFLGFFCVLALAFVFVDRWHQKRAWRNSKIAAERVMKIRKEQSPDLEELLRRGQDKFK